MWEELKYIANIRRRAYEFQEIVMEPQDYPIRHFEQMAQFATVLKQLPAQVLEHRYWYDAMGTWATIIRFQGIPIRVTGDGRDYVIIIERSSARKPPYDWKELESYPFSREEPIGDEKLLSAIRRIAVPSA
jgi:hypothetical protein